MEAKELRVGNYVLWNDEFAIVRQILELEIIFECGDIGLIADCQPIPVSKEVLLKLGFENLDSRINNYHVRGIQYIFYKNGNVDLKFGYWIIKSAEKRFQRFRSVRQLQNLYFALWGVELAFKSYVLVETERLHQQGIKCLTCGRTSYSPNDIKNLYCGHCNKFHN